MIYWLVIQIIVIGFSCDSGDRDFHDPLTEKPVDGIRIAWDHGTLTRIAPWPGYSPAYCGYARMMQLHDERLACVYESSDGNIKLTFSNNLGESWSRHSVIFSTENNIPPYVPSIIELHDHSILIACNPRPKKPYSSDRKFGIRVSKSTDGGQTWMSDQLIYEAQSTFEDGCWEPAMVQLPSGEVQLYFSNEGIYTSSNEQNISLFRSLDNGDSWTKEPEIVGFRENRRDGMPVPLLLQDKGEILVSVEDNKEGEFKPTLYHEKIEDNWSDGTINAEDTRRAYHPLSDQMLLMTYAGGPYLARLHSGEVLLSYQTTLKRKNIWDRSSMAVEIGDDAGTLFSRRSVPFHVPVDQWGLWNSLAVIGDNTPVAITSTNAYSGGNTEVWMIKGYVIPEFEVPSGNVMVDGTHDEECWQNEWPYFVGSRSAPCLRATISADAEFVYLAAEIDDAGLFTGDDLNSGNSFIFQFDPERKGFAAPWEGIYAFHLMPEGGVTIMKGSEGEWDTVSNQDVVIVGTRSHENITYFEMAIQRHFLGLDSSEEYRSGVNFVLETHDDNGEFYRESISSNDSMQPFTWCPVTIQPVI